MALTGTWNNRARGYIDPPELLHTADPAHGDLDAPDPWSWRYRAPEAGTELGAGAEEYPGQEWVVVTGGRVEDMTPADHAPIGDGHDVDRGAAASQLYGAPPLQFADEVYGSKRFEADYPAPIAEAALTRGLNGLPENNPDGYRAGYVEQFYVDRKLAVGERFHDARVVHPNVPTLIADAPVPEGHASSPFSSLARMVTRTWQTPMVRREPSPWDEDITRDGTTDQGPFYDPPPATWVAG